VQELEHNGAKDTINRSTPRNGNASFLRDPFHFGIITIDLLEHQAVRHRRQQQNCSTCAEESRFCQANWQHRLIQQIHCFRSRHTGWSSGCCRQICRKISTGVCLRRPDSKWLVEVVAVLNKQFQFQNLKLTHPLMVLLLRRCTRFTTWVRSRESFKGDSPKELWLRPKL
jgi:hypothetical protein